MRGSAEAADGLPGAARHRHGAPARIPRVAERVAAARPSSTRTMLADVNAPGALGVLFDLVRDAERGHRRRRGRRRATSPSIREAFDHFDLVLGIIALRRAEEAAPPVPVDGDRAADRRAPRGARNAATSRAPTRSARISPRAASCSRIRRPARAGNAARSSGRGRSSRRRPGTHVAAARSSRPFPAPTRKAIIARDAKAVSPSYTRGYPLVMARGEGAIVEDVDGNLFLDCAAGIAVNSTGHSHPDVVAAIVEQSQKFLHMSGTDFYYEPQVRLAEEIAPHRADRRRRQDRSSATRAPRPTKRRSSWRAITRSGRS